MRTLLTNATFGRLYLAQIVSLAGTGLMTVALGLLAYRLAGDDAAQVSARRWRSRWWRMW